MQVLILMTGSDFIPSLDSVIKWIVSPLAFVIIVGFILGSAIPQIWILIERMWLRIRLGGSTASQLVSNYAEEDYKAQIREMETDEGSIRSLAVVQAIIRRLADYSFHDLTDEYRNTKNEIIDPMYKTAIKNLNEGWRLGLPRTILDEYMETILNSASDSQISRLDKIIGRGAVSVVTYALGDIKKGNDLAKENWEYASRIEECKENGDRAKLKWIASYGYFNSTMFLGRFQDAMEMMGKQWTDHYEALCDKSKNDLKSDLGNLLILNPVLSIPRHHVLAAAFNESPLYEENSFPDRATYEEFESNKDKTTKIEKEFFWINSWYRHAITLCEKSFDETGLSLNFSHAYCGFYYTLLSLDPETPKDLNLCEKITDAFERIPNDAPIPSLYVKHGFYGVFHLIQGRDGKALDCLREAAQFSSISGNSFADCLFMCCHALAAARLNKYDNRYLNPEVKEYLAKAYQLQRRIRGKFYPNLYEITRAAIYSLEGKSGAQLRFLIKGRRGSVGKRIKSIFSEKENQRGLL